MLIITDKSCLRYIYVTKLTRQSQKSCHNKLMIFTAAFNPVALKLGPIVIHWYALMYIGGIFLGYRIINHYRKQLNVNVDACLDLINYCVLGLLLGGRLGYVAFYNGSYYLKNPLEVLYVWQGGMAFHGGLIGAIIGVYLFCKHYKVSTFKLLDYLCLATTPGLFLGRIGNFINGELIGRPTNQKWGVIFPQSDSLLRHPSQLYEALGEGLCLGLILWVILTRFKAKAGYVLAACLCLYGCIRFGLEYFRQPDAQIGLLYANLSLGQYLCLAMILTGIAVFFMRRNSCD